MSNEIVPAAPLQLLAAPPPPAHHRPPESPLVLIHRHLRGRYPLAIALGVVLAIPAAIGGWFALPPTYQSTGIVRVAPTLPKILYQNEDNQLMPMFDSFVATQASYIKSRRVLELAVNNADLRKAGWPAAPEGTALLDKALEAGAKKGGELITVTVKHAKPALAQAALNAILTSYAAVEDELNGTKAGERETALTQRVTELDRELSSTRSQISTLAEKYGTDDLDDLRATRMQAVVQLKSSIDELDLRIAHESSSESPADANGAVNPESVAEHDKTLRGLIDEREKLAVQIATLGSKLTDKHPTMIEMRGRLAALDAAIATRAAQSRQDGAPAESNLEKLKRQRSQLVTLHDKALEDLKDLGRTRMNIVALRERAEEFKKDLNDTNTRLDQMRVERQSTQYGRISIPQYGDLPVSPSTDRRSPSPRSVAWPALAPASASSGSAVS
jgi:uncharacterized protein involved in exopolysaccharide biosynthesis